MALLVYIYLTQSNIIYLPDLPGRQLDATPQDIGLEYEDVSLETSDGVRVHGWFVPGSSKRTLLYFHSNAGKISHRLHSIRQFHNLGLSVFIVDYRGYGQSEGSPSEEGLYRDAEAAWRYLVENRGLAAADVVSGDSRRAQRCALYIGNHLRRWTAALPVLLLNICSVSV